MKKDSNREDLVAKIREKWELMLNHLDEPGRRVWAATEAAAIGHGGMTLVHEATGMSRSAITRGMEEKKHPELATPPDRKRMFGGGRKKNQ